MAYWLLHETDRFSAVFTFIDKIVSPFIIGAALAFVLNVPMRAIERCFQFIKNKTFRRAVSLTLTFVVIIGVLTALLWLLVPQIIDTVRGMIDQLPVFFNDTKDWIVSYLEKHPQVMNWIEENIGKLDFDAITAKGIAWLESGLSVLIPSLLALVGGIYTGIFNGVIAIVFAIYCLIRKEILATQLRRLLYSFAPEHVGDEVVRVLRMTNATFSGFISGQFIEAIILGTLFAIFMTIFKMPHVILISVVIAITALVPIVGAFVGCVIGAFFILVTNPIQAIWFVVMFLILQQFENNVIYPKVVGKSVGLPGMWVLLAVAVGGAIMGVAGMLLMIPVFSVLYTLLREFTDRRLEQKGIDRKKVNAQPLNISEERKKKQETHKKPKSQDTEQ